MDTDEIVALLGKPRAWVCKHGGGLHTKPNSHHDGDTPLYPPGIVLNEPTLHALAFHPMEEAAVSTLGASWE